MTESLNNRKKLGDISRDVFGQPSTFLKELSCLFFYHSGIICEVEGEENLENLPDNQPLVAVANHPFGLPEIIGILSILGKAGNSGRRVSIIGSHREKYISKLLNIHVVETGKNFLKEIQEALKNNSIILIFPTGGRISRGKIPDTITGPMVPYQSGAARIISGKYTENPVPFFPIFVTAGIDDIADQAMHQMNPKKYFSNFRMQFGRLYNTFYGKPRLLRLIIGKVEDESNFREHLDNPKLLLDQIRRSIWTLNPHKKPASIMTFSQD